MLGIGDIIIDGQYHLQCLSNKNDDNFNHLFPQGQLRRLTLTGVFDMSVLKMQGDLYIHGDSQGWSTMSDLIKHRFSNVYKTVVNKDGYWMLAKTTLLEQDLFNHIISINKRYKWQQNELDFYMMSREIHYANGVVYELQDKNVQHICNYVKIDYKKFLFGSQINLAEVILNGKLNKKVVRFVLPASGWTSKWEGMYEVTFDTNTIAQDLAKEQLMKKIQSCY